MSAWIGPAGALVEVLQLKGSLSVKQSRPASYKTTLGGRTKVQRGQRTNRVWNASADYLRPAETANLLALDEGGTPPWVWVEPYAQVTNLLSPAQSVLAPGTWSGSGVVKAGSASATDGTVALHTLTHSSGGTMNFALRAGSNDFPAVIPGLTIAWSVYVRGAGNIVAEFLDWSGQTIVDVGSSYSHTDFERVAVSGTAPDGAVKARIWVSGAIHAGLPAFTWTPSPAAWSVGRGCNRAVVEGLSEAVQAASSTNSARRYSSLSFTVREVG